MRRLLPLLALAACGTRGSLYTAPLKPLPLVGTQGALVQVVPQTDRAVVVTGAAPYTRTVRLSDGARAAVAVPGTDTVAVLTGAPKAPTLDLVDAAGLTATVLPTPGYFDAVTFSPDGRFGVLTYLASARGGQLVARNLNEVGLLDTASLSLTRLQLDTESLAPRSVVFGPEEGARRLVAVTLERGVAVLDALHPEVPTRRISVRPQGSSGDTPVLEAVFSRNAHWLFLRVSGQDDVVAVELGSEVGAPVSASVNFVAGGRGLADIETAPDGADDAVLAVYAGSREAFLLDARGIQDNHRRLALTDVAGHVVRMTGSTVLLWNEGSRTVTAWDVQDGRSGVLALDGAASAPLVVPALDKALFPLPQVSSSAGTGPALATVSLTDETNRVRLHLQGVQLAQAFAASAYDAQGQRLFFSVASSPTVVSMDLRTLQLVELALDATPQRLFYLPGSDLVAADHGGPLGDVTFAPAGTSDRAGALRLSDFALSGDLDRPEDVR